MNHEHPHPSTSIFKSRQWVLHEATQQDLLEYLHRLLLVQQEQQFELMTLVTTIVEERLAMQGEMEQVIMEVASVDDVAPRTPWLSVGLAGLAGYLIAHHLD